MQAKTKDVTKTDAIVEPVIANDVSVMEDVRSLSFLEKLTRIQHDLKAPKNLYNSFGKYSYRNAEGILESFKPYGVKYGTTIVVLDDIVLIGDRYYVKAIATMYDCKTGDSISTTAFAREPIDKKGMDDSQITGTASSYARKYALNGLLLLDDTKDADTDEYHNQTNQPVTQNKAKTYPNQRSYAKANNSDPFGGMNPNAYFGG